LKQVKNPFSTKRDVGKMVGETGKAGVRFGQKKRVKAIKTGARRLKKGTTPKDGGLGQKE